MPYLTTGEPLFCYPELMHIVWEKKNGDILSSEFATTVQSHAQTQSTPSSDQTTIYVTSQVEHDETLPSDESILSVTTQVQVQKFNTSWT